MGRGYVCLVASSVAIRGSEASRLRERFLLNENKKGNNQKQVHPFRFILKSSQKLSQMHPTSRHDARDWLNTHRALPVSEGQLHNDQQVHLLVASSIPRRMPVQYRGLRSGWGQIWLVQRAKREQGALETEFWWQGRVAYLLSANSCVVPYTSTAAVAYTTICDINVEWFVRTSTCTKVQTHVPRCA